MKLLEFFRKPRKIKVGWDRYERVAQHYREFRIREIAEATQKSYADASALADRWIVHMCTVQVGDDAPEIRFIPSPIWDDEWMMSRNGFPTREEALAEVQRVGGKLLTDS
jgi:hypothetical protein